MFYIGTRDTLAVQGNGTLSFERCAYFAVNLGRGMRYVKRTAWQDDI